MCIITRNSCHVCTNQSTHTNNTRPIKMMTAEQAAVVIQNAWRRFDDDRKDRFIDSYNNELWDTYYRECCEPIDQSDYDEYTYPYPEAEADDGSTDIDYDDPPDEVVYARYGY